MSDFMDFAASESAALSPTPWDKWLSAVNSLTGVNLDGDQKEDGYSLDTLSQWFDEGLSSESAAMRVRQALL